jgi:hypothetical protein
MMSGNMGINVKHIHEVAMKNEFLFPAFSLTSRAKHYYAYQGAREGNVYEELEMEVKGVELRSSKVPPNVMRKLKRLMQFILDEVLEHGNLSILDVYDEIALLENQVRESVARGGYDFMLSSQIKSPSAYVGGEEAAAYQHYGLWKTVFADKYGQVLEPPYLAVKVPVDFDSPVKLRAWIATIPDLALRERMAGWCSINQKNQMSQMLLPESILASRGIPPEIVSGVNLRKMMYETLSGFYLVLESLGIYMIDDNLTKLVSDFHTPRITVSKFD